MTDTDEPQASGSDYPDAQELISHQQEEPSEVCSWGRKTGTERSRSRQKAAAPGEPSDHPNSKSSAASAEVLLISSDSEIEVSAVRPECSIAPSKRKRRSQSSRQQAESVTGLPDNESSSDSSLSPQSPGKSLEASKQQKSKFNLKAIFAYHFRGRKFKAAAHRKYKNNARRSKKKKKYESTQMPTGRPPLTASPQEQKRRLLDRGFQFPFVEKHYGEKHIPLKMVLGYEQAAAKGYFKYIQVLKYEEHLKKALKALQASDDLEKECVVLRKHKYLDDEGPISPIQETDDDEDSLNSDTQEQLDARVVENSSFILSSTIPSKKKSKRGRNCAKAPEVIEIVDEEDGAEGNSVPLRGSPRLSIPCGITLQKTNSLLLNVIQLSEVFMLLLENETPLGFLLHKMGTLTAAAVVTSWGSLEFLWLFADLLIQILIHIHYFSGHLCNLVAKEGIPVMCGTDWKASSEVHLKSSQN